MTPREIITATGLAQWVADEVLAAFTDAGIVLCRGSDLVPLNTESVPVEETP